MDVRLAAMILFGVIVSGRAEAAETIQVDVYIQQGNWTQPLRYSELMASEIFARSDVRVTWHAGDLPAVPSIGRRCIGIRMVDHAPVLLVRGALASARPYGSSGSLISVYVDRVQQLKNVLQRELNRAVAALASHFSERCAGRVGCSTAPIRVIQHVEKLGTEL